jgi:hypothetical protein
MSKVTSLPAAKGAVESTIGENISASVQDGILTLTIDLKKRLRQSASGKTTIVATSAGNQAVMGGGGVILGINAYVK